MVKLLILYKGFFKVLSPGEAAAWGSSRPGKQPPGEAVAWGSSRLGK